MPTTRWVPAPPSGIWRVARGPNPLAIRPRSEPLIASKAGNRFDDPSNSYGVLYFGTSLEVCFGETLAKMRPSPTLLKAIPGLTEDWHKLGFMDVGAVAAEWRHRNIAVRVKVPPSSRFLDVEDPETLQALRGPWLAAFECDDLDVSVVRGADRRVTRFISRWARLQVDEDGEPYFAGIRYLSRLNSDWECWAVFDHVELEVAETRSITKDMPELQQVAKLFDLVVH